jgi:hypothetical protein
MVPLLGYYIFNKYFGGTHMLKTNRGLIKWLFFSIITFGIYAFVLIAKKAEETNITCKGDGKETKGFWIYLLLSIVTFGIYPIVWGFQVVERHATYLRAHNEKEILSGLGWLLWSYVGGLLFGIGAFVAMYLDIKQWNKVNEIHNRKYGLNN